MQCKKCGHEWVSRTKKPKSCPACKSYAWALIKEMATRRKIECRNMKVILEKQGVINKEK